MMIALELTVAWPVGRPFMGSLGRRVLRYAPFALLLAGYLVVETIVNSRSYVVRENHYAFGWHAVPHALRCAVYATYVGRSIVASHYLVAAVMALLLWFGTPRVRFFVVWIFVTLAPVSFFTWGNESRYLPCQQLGSLCCWRICLQYGQAWLAKRITRATARAALIVAVVVLSARFAVYAEKGSEVPQAGVALPVRMRGGPRGRTGNAPGAREIAVSADDVYFGLSRALPAIRRRRWWPRARPCYVVVR